MSITTADNTITRDAGLEKIVEILRDQQAHKVDIVTPAAAMRARNGRIVLKGTGEAIITADGVSSVDGEYLPTGVFDEGISEKLKIPLAYVRRMRLQAPDLYDTNVNGWLHGRARLVEGTREILREGESRSFMLRLFRGEDGGTGVARALLSSKFNRIENLDVLMCALEGVKAAGVEINVQGADLDDRRMYVRIAAPQIQVYAPALLRNYRSPFNGNRGSDNPVVSAGIEIKNSEVGGGKFSITPRIVFQVCRNGVTMAKDVLARTHLGARLDDGVIQWSDETQRIGLDLVKAQTRDAVRTFLNVDYVTRTIEAMQERAETPVSAPGETIENLGKALLYDEATTNGILEHFIKGGDLSAGGIMHAVTSFAQEVTSPATASYLESTAVQAMELAATSR